LRSQFELLITQC